MTFLDLKYQYRYTIYISGLIEMFAEVITKLSTTRGTPIMDFIVLPGTSDRSPRNELSAKSV